MHIYELEKKRYDIDPEASMPDIYPSDTSIPNTDTALVPLCF